MKEGHIVLHPGLYVARKWCHTDKKLLVSIESRCFPLDQYPETSQRAAEDWKNFVEKHENPGNHEYFILEVKANEAT